MTFQGRTILPCLGLTRLPPARRALAGESPGSPAEVARLLESHGEQAGKSPALRFHCLICHFDFLALIFELFRPVPRAVEVLPPAKASILYFNILFRVRGIQGVTSI